MSESWEQELKKLYQIEYDNQVPEVWGDIEKKLGKDTGISHELEETAEKAAKEEQRQRPPLADGEENPREEVLEFPKLGKRRWLTAMGTIAACFVLIGVYLFQNGTINQKKTTDSMQGEETAYSGEPMTAASGMQEACDSLLPDESNQATEVAEAAQEIESNGVSEGGEMPMDTGGVVAWINVEGRLYTFISLSEDFSRRKTNLEYVGMSVPVEGEKPKEDLQLTGDNINGMVYSDGEEYVYVEEEETGLVYVFQLVSQ